MKIAVAGTGYVGLSLAVLLSQKHEVVAVDIIPEKVNMINRRISPIQDDYIEKYFAVEQEALAPVIPEQEEIVEQPVIEEAVEPQVPVEPEQEMTKEEVDEAILDLLMQVIRKGLKKLLSFFRKSC